MEEKIIEVINDIRPYIMNDGGNINFVKFQDNIVYIELSGACLNCFMQDFTLKQGIEKLIKDKIPSVKEVKLVSDYPIY